MTDELIGPEAGPADNNLVILGPDGDPLPHPRGVAMIEVESYERVIEGLKMAADACAHLAKQEPQHGQTWMDIGKLLDQQRLGAVRLAGLKTTLTQQETQTVRGAPSGWRKTRDRFLDGLRQATGGMRQLATCFRGDLQWSFMAQQLERRTEDFRALLYGRRAKPQARGLILPPHYTRH